VHVLFQAQVHPSTSASPGHPFSGQGDACVGCFHGAGLSGQEHGDLTEGRRGAAEPCHQGQALGAAHAGDTGQRNDLTFGYRITSSWESKLIIRGRVMPTSIGYVRPQVSWLSSGKPCTIIYDSIPTYCTPCPFFFFYNNSAIMQGHKQ